MTCWPSFFPSFVMAWSRGHLTCSMIPCPWTRTIRCVERKWLQAIWRGRGNVRPDAWRLYFVVMLGGKAVGMQDLIGVNFDTCRTVSSFSWLAPSVRQQGLAREMRAAILHLAFEGFGAAEAISEAFFDNVASNRVSEAMGYQPNGTDWATRRGAPAVLNRRRLTRADWKANRRSDLRLFGVEACKPVVHITEAAR